LYGTWLFLRKDFTLTQRCAPLSILILIQFEKHLEIKIINKIKTIFKKIDKIDKNIKIKT